MSTSPSDSELLILQLQAQINELTKTVSAVMRDNNELTLKVGAVMRDNGLECAINEGVKKLERVFAPLQSLATPHSYAEGEAETIDELRASLARPNFDGLETNFGRRPSTGNQTGSAA